MQPNIRFFLPCSDFTTHQDQSGYDVVGLYDNLIMTRFPENIVINIVIGIQCIDPHRDRVFEVQAWMDNEYIGKWSDLPVRSTEYYSSVVVRVTTDEFHVSRPGVIRFVAYMDGNTIGTHYLEVKDGRSGS